MDSSKTGTLIAERRCELGLTQKQLAEQLHLSDRTISRWERGVGFPDISLLEPLADALEVSVLELLQGERMEAPHQEAETTIRDAAQTFGTKFRLSLKRLRWALIALAVVAALSLYGVLRLWSMGYLERYIHTEEISPSEAVAICPFALITTEDYEVIQQLLNDEDITRHLPAEFDENHRITVEDLFKADDSVLSRYEGMLHIEGEPARLIEISVSYSTIYICYDVGNQRCYLQVNPLRETVEKSCAQYGGGEEFEVLYIISNQNNQTFSMMKETSRLSLLLSE